MSEVSVIADETAFSEAVPSEAAGTDALWSETAITAVLIATNTAPESVGAMSERYRRFNLDVHDV